VSLSGFRICGWENFRQACGPGKPSAEFADLEILGEIAGLEILGEIACRGKPSAEFAGLEILGEIADPGNPSSN
jgi:hypothetical protein